jgi:hypothetical protein
MITMRAGSMSKARRDRASVHHALALLGREGRNVAADQIG